MVTYPIDFNCLKSLMNIIFIMRMAYDRNYHGLRFDYLDLR